MQLLGLCFPNTCIRRFQRVWHTTCCYGKTHTLEESYFEEDEHVRENLHDA